MSEAPQSLPTLESLKAQAFDLINELGTLDRQIKGIQQLLQAKNQEILNFSTTPLAPATPTDNVPVEDIFEATA